MAEFSLPERSVKPRKRGITSMIDYGPDTFGWTGGVNGISDLLSVAADYIDYAKIYAMNSLLIPADTLKETVALYRDAGVMPFAGGISFEYAWQNNALDAMQRHLKSVGIHALEVSENYITLSSEERKRVVGQLQTAGFGVIYEFGRKNPTEPIALETLASIVLEVQALGIPRLTIEQSELDALVAHDPTALQQLAQASFFDALVIEADPYRFPKQHAELITEFGPHVNLANISPGQVLRLEGFRQGIGRAVDYSLIRR